MRWVFLLLFILFLYLQYSLWIGQGSLPSAWRIQEQISAQKLQNKQLHDRNEALAAEVLDLKEGLAAIEEKARNELGMIKKDEVFFQVIEK